LSDESKKKIMYSLEKENETWYYSDIDELIQDGYREDLITLEGKDDLIVYSGVSHVKKASTYLNDIVETLTENAHEECGEVSSSWLESVGDTLQKHMEKCLDDWCYKYGQDAFFGLIENIKPIHIVVLKVDDAGVKWMYRDMDN